MSNPFITSAKRLIYRQGTGIDYVNVTTGVYNVETGTVGNAEVTTTVIAFPKRVKVNNFNYPNLVGKEVLEFLVVCKDLPSSPRTSDKIKYKGNTYAVESYNEVMARGELVIYKIIASKG
jgi:hypothetical protein